MTAPELTLTGVGRLVLGVVLVAAAAGKLRARDRAAAGVAAVGVPPGAARPLAVALALVEAALGLLVLLGVALRPAAVGAAALGLLFATALLLARARGKRRVPCGCFGGARERPIWLLAGRALGLAALGAGVAAGDRLPEPSAQALLAAAVVVLALAVAALAALVLALYRQVGVLTLRLAPQGALEIDEEGPAVGADAPPLAGLERRGSALVLFSSPTCRLCHALLPAARALAGEGLAVRVADEDAEPETFRRWNVPGTPFAVHVVDGRVAAKGLVNTLEQLESVVATGYARVGRAA
ncbi:MAG TPA: MauE/DoxX family redox-associated membrane protein [Gaiellaceae bacterium]|nr:MauE/DoxX family redox-associated membrane protein [Gaiellaceae bacterium]